MSIAAAILTRKEIVAVLIELNNKIDQLGQPDSLHSATQLTTYLSLRDHYLQQLIAMKTDIDTDISKDMPANSKVA